MSGGSQAEQITSFNIEGKGVDSGARGANACNETSLLNMGFTEIPRYWRKKVIPTLSIENNQLAL